MALSITLPDNNIKTGVHRDRVSRHFGAAQALPGMVGIWPFAVTNSNSRSMKAVSLACRRTGLPAHASALLPSAELAVGQPGFVHRPSFVNVPGRGLSRVRSYARPRRSGVNDRSHYGDALICSQTCFGVLRCTRSFRTVIMGEDGGR